MLKLIVTLVIGMAMGGAMGFYTGSTLAEKAQKEILRSQQESWTQQLEDCATCKDQKAKLEQENKEIVEELDINQTRGCFVSAKTLNPPEFDPPGLEPIGSDSRGDIMLKWKPVVGAKQYIVSVEDQEGKVISTTEVEGETWMVINRHSRAARLAEANYFARIAVVNGLDRVGPEGPRKPVHFLPLVAKVNKRPMTKKRK
jgi:hypothetical protein